MLFFLPLLASLSATTISLLLTSTDSQIPHQLVGVIDGNKIGVKAAQPVSLELSNAGIASVVGSNGSVLNKADDNSIIVSPNTVGSNSWSFTIGSSLTPFEYLGGDVYSLCLDNGLVYVYQAPGNCTRPVSASLLGETM